MWLTQLLLILAGLCAVVQSLTCYTGFQAFGSTGSSVKECEDSGDYCYNATASAGSILNIAKAGCSSWRCMLARNTCISTELQGVPVRFCCCNTGDRCNGRD